MMEQRRAHDSQIVRAKENIKLSHGGPSYIQASDTNPPSGHNVNGPNLLRGPEIGNSHRLNTSLLKGSTWDQRDGSMSDQCVVKCQFHAIHTFANKICILLFSNSFTFMLLINI